MVLGTDGTTVSGTTLSALGDSFTWTDRLGSAQSTYPYGTDIGSYPAGADAVDFATYTKEGSTGLEYAMNRFYSGGLGRFMTVDPSSTSARPGNPQSWNRYSYARRDPVNFNDPSGTDEQWAGSGTCFVGVEGEEEDPDAWAACDYYTEGPAPVPYLAGIQEGLNALASAFGRARLLEKRAIADAINALNNSSKCKGLFGNAQSWSQGWDPATVLAAASSLSGANVNGYGIDITLRPFLLDGANAEVKNSWVLFGPSNGATILVNGWSLISNVENLSDVPNTPNFGTDYNASVILHELGHVYNAASPFGSGGSGIPDDAGNTTASQNNTGTVMKDCFGEGG